MIVKDVRLQIALTLFLIVLLSLWKFFSLHLLFILISLLIISQLVDFLFNFLLFKKKPFLSYSAVVSSLLIFLILDKSAPIWAFILAAILAISSKHIIRVGPKHIFNPAAFGAFLVSFFPRVPIAWWGVAWNPLLSLLIIIGSLILLKRLRRLYIVGGFLLVYLFYYILTTGSLLGLKALIDGTVILFSFIMLPEPQTTPILNYWQKIFGLFVGFVLIAILKLSSGLPVDPLVLALLTSDLLSFIIIKSTAPKPTL